MAKLSPWLSASERKKTSMAARRPRGSSNEVAPMLVSLISSLWSGEITYTWSGLSSSLVALTSTTGILVRLPIIAASSLL